MEGKITVIMCPCDRAPYVTNITPTLKNMQKIVGGYIETVKVMHDAVIVCNEEGRIKGLADNHSIFLDHFVGDVFICGCHGDNLDSLEGSSKDLLLKICKESWKEWEQKQTQSAK